MEEDPSLKYEYGNKNGGWGDQSNIVDPPKPENEVRNFPGAPELPKPVTPEQVTALAEATGLAPEYACQFLNEAKKMWIDNIDTNIPDGDPRKDILQDMKQLVDHPSDEVATVIKERIGQLSEINQETIKQIVFNLENRSKELAENRTPTNVDLFLTDMKKPNPQEYYDNLRPEMVRLFLSDQAEFDRLTGNLGANRSSGYGTVFGEAAGMKKLDNRDDNIYFITRQLRKDQVDPNLSPAEFAKKFANPLSLG